MVQLGVWQMIGREGRQCATVTGQNQPEACQQGLVHAERALCGAQFKTGAFCTIAAGIKPEKHTIVCSPSPGCAANAVQLRASALRVSICVSFERRTRRAQGRLCVSNHLGFRPLITSACGPLCHSRPLRKPTTRHWGVAVASYCVSLRNLVHPPAPPRSMPPWADVEGQVPSLSPVSRR